MSGKMYRDETEPKGTGTWIAFGHTALDLVNLAGIFGLVFLGGGMASLILLSADQIKKKLRRCTISTSCWPHSCSLLETGCRRHLKHSG